MARWTSSRSYGGPMTTISRRIGFVSQTELF
jgi:hypothetical protein